MNDPHRWGDPWPPDPWTIQRRRNIAVAVLLTALVVLCLVGLALMPASPLEPGFDPPTTTQGAHTP